MEITAESIHTNQGKDVLFNAAWIKQMADDFLGDTDPQDPHVNPLYADFRGLGPIYIQVGEPELLLDDSRHLAQRAQAAGVEVRLDVYPDQQHTFQMMAGRASETDAAIEALAEWVRPRIGVTEDTRWQMLAESTISA